MKELLKKKTVKVGLLIIVLLVAAVIIGINVQSAQRQKEYDGHIEAAQKYLTELDYEQAIAEYILAYEIEPNEELLDALEQTYLAYAQSYVDAGDYESAISILEEGYAQIGRDNLRERIEELQAEMEAEQRRQQEEEEKDALKELVESTEFWTNVDALRNLSSRLGHNQYITDEQLKEKCRPFIDSLEQYRELYQDYSYSAALLELYIATGEYKTCIEFKQKLEESGSDWDNHVNEHLRDEYGRIYWYNNKAIVEGVMDSGDGLQEVSIEFDNQGRMVKKTINNDGLTGLTSPGQQNEITWLYEYDTEGRLIKAIVSCYAHIVDGNNGNYEGVTTYEYNRTGFTEYYTATGYSDIDHGTATSYSGHSRDCVIDDYGKITYGEIYDYFFENL